MKGLRGFVLILVVGLASGHSHARTPLEDAAEVAAHQASIDLAIAPLRSMQDVRIHLRTAPASPLFALTPAQRRQFIDGLVFTPDGLASYSHAALSHGLTVSAAYKVLALIGAQSAIAEIDGLRPPENDVEARMLQASMLSPMALSPPWRHGLCVINGRDRRCVPWRGSNCSRACDP